MITEAVCYPNGWFGYGKVVWENIRLSPDEKKTYKNKHQGDKYNISVQLDISRNLMERIYLNKDQEFGNQALKISCNKDNYIKLIYENSKIRQISVNIYEEKIIIDDMYFRITISPVDRKKHKKRKTINRHLEKNPYPIKVYKGGSCSPK